MLLVLKITITERVYTKTANEPKRPRPKRPIIFWYVQNGLQQDPKRPMARSKTAHRLKRSTKLMHVTLYWSLGI